MPPFCRVRSPASWRRRFRLRTLALCTLPLFASLLAGEPADWIWTAKYIITMDPQRRVIENGAVAIGDERILAVGSREEIDHRFEARARLDKPGALIAPGLINTHGHAAMSLFRGIADDLRLQEWLEKYIFPAEAKNVSPDFVRWGTKLACLEMLLSGTTTFTDMYYFEDVAAEAAKEAGMRGVMGETIIRFPVADAKTPEDALKLADRLLARFRNDPLIVPAVAPHAVYTNSDETLKAARALANRYGAPLLIHVSETKKENDDIQAAHGMSPTALLDSLGVLNGRTIAAHEVWANDTDLKILRKRGTGVAHCPSSNMKLASGAAPVTAMLALGISVGLGTDGPAGSNNGLDLFEEMDLAAKLQKLITADPRSVPASAALEMATLRGAKALGMEKEIGSLEPGKRADLIAVRLDEPNAVPMYDVYSQMVYALKGSNVSDVMVNGRMVVRNREALTLNRAEVLAKAGEYQRRIKASLQ